MSDTTTGFRAWLFRLEMRARSRFGLDCAGCISRECARVAKAGGGRILIPHGEHRATP